MLERIEHCNGLGDHNGIGDCCGLGDRDGIGNRNGLGDRNFSATATQHMLERVAHDSA